MFPTVELYLASYKEAPIAWFGCGSELLTFELRSIPMQLIKYASVHFLPFAPNSILVSLKCGNHLKLEVLVPVYKFNSNIMLLHQFTTTVQAPPIGAMWLLLAINSLVHEEFQFVLKQKR